MANLACRGEAAWVENTRHLYYSKRYINKILCNLRVYIYNRVLGKVHITLAK